MTIRSGSLRMRSPCTAGSRSRIAMAGESSVARSRRLSITRSWRSSTIVIWRMGGVTHRITVLHNTWTVFRRRSPSCGRSWTPIRRRRRCKLGRCWRAWAGACWCLLACVGWCAVWCRLARTGVCWYECWYPGWHAGLYPLTGLFVMISHVGCWRLSEILGDCGRLQQIGRLTGKVPCCCGR